MHVGTWNGLWCNLHCAGVQLGAAKCTGKLLLCSLSDLQLATLHAAGPARCTPSACQTAETQRRLLQVFDGYFVKYFASVVALLVYGAPIYFRDPSKRGSQDDITQDYIRAMRLLQNTSRCIPAAVEHGCACMYAMGTKA